MNISVVDNISDAAGLENFNRPPLHAKPMERIALGRIRPDGWIKHQLDLMFTIPCAGTAGNSRKSLFFSKATMSTVDANVREKVYAPFKTCKRTSYYNSSAYPLYIRYDQYHFALRLQKESQAAVEHVH